MSDVMISNNMSLTTQEKIEDFYYRRLRRLKENEHKTPEMLWVRARVLAKKEMEIFDDAYFEELTFKNFFKRTR